MDTRKRIFKTEVEHELKETQRLIQKDKDTIQRLRHSNMNIDFLEKQTQRIRESCLEKEEKVKSLLSRLEDFNTGKLDDEINKIYQKGTEETKMKFELTVVKKKEKKQEKLKNKAKTKQHIKVIKDSNREQRYLKKNIKYDYKNFLKSVDLLPEYMKRNLKTMPNNKGYYWRGCIFFGDKPYNPRHSTVIFEKKKGGVMRITDFNDYETKIYEKIKDEKRKLISCQPRRKIN